MTRLHNQRIRPSAAVDQHRCTSCRRGFSMIELVVAAGLLATVLSVVASLTVRTGRLWQDSRHYRLAVEEVSNQLERLTSLDKAEHGAALSDLAPSPQIRASLPNPELTAETLSDEFGTRLVLRLNWDRPGKSVPVTLVGWIDPLSAISNSAAGETTP